MNSLEYARDNRNADELIKNIGKGNVLARLALIGLKTYFKFARGIEIDYKIIPDVFWKTGEEAVSHEDAILITGEKNISLEIKCMTRDFPEEIDIRVTRALIDSKANGLLFLSEARKFTLIPTKDVLARKSEVGGRWNKKIIKINRSDYTWKEHYYNVFENWLDEYKKWLATEYYPYVDKGNKLV